MNEETKKYQLVLIISPLADQDRLNQLIESVKKWVNGKGGSISEETAATEKKEQKKLAYPIQKFQSAFQEIIDFILPSQLIGELNNFLNLEEDIIRYMIAIQKPKGAKSTSSKNKLAQKKFQKIIDYKTGRKIGEIVNPADQEIRKEESREKKEIKKEAPEGKKDKVKIEELDKKLEEILKE